MLYNYFGYFYKYCCVSCMPNITINYIIIITTITLLNLHQSNTIITTNYNPQTKRMLQTQSITTVNTSLPYLSPPRQPNLYTVNMVNGGEPWQSKITQYLNTMYLSRQASASRTNSNIINQVSSIGGNNIIVNNNKYIVRSPLYAPYPYPYPYPIPIPYQPILVPTPVFVPVPIPPLQPQISGLMSQRTPIQDNRIKQIGQQLKDRINNQLDNKFSGLSPNLPQSTVFRNISFRITYNNASTNTNNISNNNTNTNNNNNSNSISNNDNQIIDIGKKIIQQIINNITNSSNISVKNIRNNTTIIIYNTTTNITTSNTNNTNNTNIVTNTNNPNPNNTPATTIPTTTPTTTTTTNTTITTTITNSNTSNRNNIRPPPNRDVVITSFTGTMSNNDNTNTDTNSNRNSNTDNTDSNTDNTTANMDANTIIQSSDNTTTDIMDASITNTTENTELIQIQPPVVQVTAGSPSLSLSPPTGPPTATIYSNINLPPMSPLTLSYDEYKKLYPPSKQLKSQQGQVLKQSIYKRNLQMINKFNQNPNRTYNMGYNQFTDIDQKQFQQLYLKLVVPEQYLRNTLQFRIMQTPYNKPDNISINWSCKSGVVKNLTRCAVSYIIAALDSIQTTGYIYNQDLSYLSIQQFISCVKNQTLNGCKSGYYQSVFYQGVYNNIIKNIQYYYDYQSSIQGVQLQCNTKFIQRNKQYLKLEDYTRLKTGDCKQMVFQLQYRSIAVAIWARKFQFYKQGTFSPQQSDINQDANLGLALVGYYPQKGYLVKNSWGVKWGIKGYAYVSEDTGICNYGIYVRLTLSDQQIQQYLKLQVQQYDPQQIQNFPPPMPPQSCLPTDANLII